MHLFSAEDLSRADIEALLDAAEGLRDGSRRASHPRSVLGLLFFQPSTRTRFGFHAAMARLGGSAIELSETKHSEGMTNAESLSDTIRTVSDYCDLLVIRHRSTNDVRAALSASAVPVINGGSGHEHHPTQALVDLFAIRRHCGRLDDLEIGLVGDLGSSRSARSLLQALRHFRPSGLRLMAPPGRGLPPEALPPGSSAANLDHLDLPGLDVVYVAGLPEGLGEGRLTAGDRLALRITAAALAGLDPSPLVLCPMPRVDEIDPGVDSLGNAGYFRQSAEGLSVRMAVLDAWLSGASARGR